MESSASVVFIGCILLLALIQRVKAEMVSNISKCSYAVLVLFRWLTSEAM